MYRLQASQNKPHTAASFWSGFPIPSFIFSMSAPF
jgi:hypothetical protein